MGMLWAVSASQPQDEYTLRATPPARFREAITSEGYVICLKRNCGLPMVVDPLVFSQTRTMVHEWKRNNRQPVPLRLLRLLMRCLNGHTEAWHAEPAQASDARQEAEEQESFEAGLTERTCFGCGEEFRGYKRSRLCAACKSDS